MNRGKLSTKVILLAGGIGLSMAAFGGSQSAAAQAYSDESYCPAGIVYYPTYGCTVSGDAYQPYDYGHYGSLPYDASGPYYGGHQGFGHGMGGGFNHGVGFAHGGGGGFGHGEGGGHR